MWKYGRSKRHTFRRSTGKNSLRAVPILLGLLLALSPVTSAEEEHIRMTEYPGIELVQKGSVLADKDYAFSLQAGTTTDIEIWGYSGDVVRGYTSNEYSEKEHAVIMPEDDNLSGNIGCYIYNAGNAEGKTIDLKCTYYWKPLSLQGTSIPPLIDAAIRNNVPVFYFGNRSYEVKYELYSGGQPVSLNLSMTLQDIDFAQFAGFRVEDGEIHQIQCTQDSFLYCREADGYYWFYSENISCENGETTGSVRLELEQVSSFRLIFGTSKDHWSYDYGFFSKDTEDVLTTEVIEKTAELQLGMADRSMEEIDEFGLGVVRTDGTAFGGYDVPEPVLYVSDLDEELVQANIVEEKETIRYDIYQIVPEEQTGYYYDSWRMEAVLPEEVTYSSCVVYNNAGEDVTSQFDVFVSGQTVQIRRKNTMSETFYGDTYDWKLTAVMDETTAQEGSGTDGGDTFSCSAEVLVSRDGTDFQRSSNTVATTFMEETDELHSWVYYRNEDEE